MLTISDRLGMQLHDRWTRGQRLTAEEQAQLEAWYQQRDAAEDRQLNQVFTTAEIPDLQAQVETTLTQLGAVIQREVNHPPFWYTKTGRVEIQ